MKHADTKVCRVYASYYYNLSQMLLMLVQAVQQNLIKEACTIIFTITLRYDKRDPPPSSMVLAIRAYLLYQF